MKSKIFCLVAVLFCAFNNAVGAQQKAKLPRIGFLMTGSSSSSASQVKAFKEGLRELGYVVGKNLLVEYSYAEGKIERFPELVDEMLRTNVDIIVVIGNTAARTAQKATKTVPIVMLGVGVDPVETGLVESYAAPGGNLTGMTQQQSETAGKRLELLKETAPKTARVAILYNAVNPGNLAHVKTLESSARHLALTVKSFEVRGTGGFETVFGTLAKEHHDAMYLIGAALLSDNERRTAEFALKNRLPSVYTRREGVAARGLMSYGADPVNMYRRAAYFVDRILRGTKPAELPVEQPTKFELVINLKTAKQIGLIIPPNVLARADRVIK